MRFSNGQFSGKGRLLDITVPGCQIESNQKVQSGQYLQLSIALPDQASALRVDLAAVRWTKGTRFGVEFIRMDESAQRTLDAFLSEYFPQMTPQFATRKAP